MSNWLATAWDYLRTSFWFVPALMAIAGVLLAVVLAGIDLRYPELLVNDVGWLHPPDADAVRTLLSTLVGATITVLSVVFSITIVALTLAVSQLGPRLLRTFTSDRGNQMVLGTFVATFLYCLLVLWMVGLFETVKVPHLATLGALVLAVVNAGVLIFFIHHMANAIQAPNVIVAVGHELRHEIRHLYPQRLQDAAEDDDTRSAVRLELPDDAQCHAINTHRDAYVQSVNLEQLVAVAQEQDLAIRLTARPGRFVIHGTPIAQAWPAERVTSAVERAVTAAVQLGVRRTPTQDVEFEIDQLVEVALRALSPSINDAFTAMQCIDQLGAALNLLCDRKIPPHVHRDEAGVLRLVVDATTFRGISDAMFNQIRQMARSNVAVTARLLEVFEAVMRQTCTQAQRDTIWAQVQAVHRGATQAVTEPYDREDLDQRYRAIAELMSEPAAPGSAA